MTKTNRIDADQVVQAFRDTDFSEHAGNKCAIQVHLLDLDGPYLLIAVTIDRPGVEPIHISAFEAKAISARLSAVADELMSRLAERVAKSD